MRVSEHKKPLSGMSGDDWKKAIVKARRPRHNTIYFPEKYKNKLDTMFIVGRVDNLEIGGLQVEYLPRIERPIICKRGDVFPLAKDWE